MLSAELAHSLVSVKQEVKWAKKVIDNYLKSQS